MRRKLVAGNWKMFTTLPEAERLTEELVKELIDCKGVDGVDLLIAPPYPFLTRVAGVIQNSNLKGHISLAAQDLHWEEQDARTGKVSADMLSSIGVKYVIVGHSEQRAYFHESDETVHLKAGAALRHDLMPIVCVGESLEERERGEEEQVVKRQLLAAFSGIVAQRALRSIVAYEPVWAIGTGKTATPQQAQEMHTLIRSLWRELYGQAAAEELQILYGGSVKPQNAGELFAEKDIDGGLIGGASLKAGDFTAIVKAAIQH